MSHFNKSGGSPPKLPTHISVLLDEVLLELAPPPKASPKRTEGRPR